MKHHFFLFLPLLLNWSFCLAQATDTVLPKNDTLAFTLTEHNNISVEAILNAEDTLALMFHTDIGSVSLTPEKNEELGEQKGKQSSSANSWTGAKDVEFIENNKLTISALEWDSLTVWLNLLSGHDTDGKFGPNLFEGKLIELDFDKNLMFLYPSVEAISQLDSYQTFSLSTNENSSLFLEGQLNINGVKFTHKFLIHSGYGGTIIFDDAFVDEHTALKEAPVLEENELKDSFGNIIKTKKAVADNFTFCGLTFAELPFSYFDSDLDIQKTSVIGGELLKRCNWVLDIENMQIHVKPNKYTRLGFSNS